MPEADDKAAAILRLEAAGQLDPDRQGALDRLRKSGQFPTVNVAPTDSTYDAAEEKYNLPKNLLRGVQSVESSGQGSGAKSPTGVTGLMQVTLGTGAKYGLTAENRTNPYKNIDVAAQILRDNLKDSGGDVPKALMAYKGHGAVDMSDQDYINRVQKVMHMDIYRGQAPQGAQGPSPQPEGSPEASPDASEAPGAPEAPDQNPLSGAADAVLQFGQRAAQAAVFDGVVYPAHEMRRLGYSIGFPGFTPPADHVQALEQSPLGRLVGQQNLDTLSQDTPTGFWGRLSAAAGVMEPLYLPTFGSYVATRAFGADEATARMVEGMVGAGAMVHEGTKIVANYSAGKRIAEVKAAAQAKVGDAEREVAANLPGAQARLAAAQTHLQTVTDAHTAGLTEVIAKQKAEVAEAVEQGKVADMARRAHVQGALDPTEIGEALQAPGRAGIVSGGAKRLQKRTSAAYDAWKEAGTKGGLILQSGALHTGLADTATAINQLARTEGSTPAERAVADEIVHTLRPKLSIQGGVIGSTDAEIPIAQLIDLKSTVGRVGLSPQEFPVFRSRRGRLLFAKLGAQLDEVLRSLAIGNPEVQAASHDARQLAKEQARFRLTARKLLKAETPEAATAGLFAKGAPSRLWRIFKEAKPSEVTALQKSYLNLIYTTDTDAVGAPDFAAASKAWSKVSPAARRLVAAIGSPDAKIALSKMIQSRKLDINHPALVEAEGMVSGLLHDLKRAQATAENPIPTMLKRTPEMRAIESSARQGVNVAQREVNQLSRVVPEAQAKADQKVLEFVRSGGSTPGGFGRMIARRAAIGLAANALMGGHQNPATVVTNAAYIHMMLIYPTYVRAAIKTPLNTDRGITMARAIAGLLNGYYGLPGNRPHGTRPAAPPQPPQPQ